MKDMTMTQYLSLVKSKVDAINAAGSSIDTEDIILYTLNGLPATYNAFKTSVRTNLQPLSLDDLYSLLCSEEINLTADALKETQLVDSVDSSTALFSNRGRGRGRYSANRSRPYNRGGQNAARGNRTSNRSVECQICQKRGHSATSC
ncbi:hypothetical protein KFK09_029348 [Dendrobium nobile]|uniref:Retrovirus-related Pol polyprotein from transposon TNT 1-94 n=1 Tax=Dendrobium nobile TaxID=94219 RepID=A0A8T3A0D6_DENNO|nr:hypothetical protein KFK09_029348 [Dendrobium nobile]